METSTEHSLGDLIFMETSTGHSLGDLRAPATGNDTLPGSATAAFLSDVNVVLWYVAPPLLLALGTFGNVMIMVVMRGMRASQSTACLSLYFTALAVSDQCVLCSCLLWTWVDTVFSWPPSFFLHGLLCRVPKFVWCTSAITSAWFLVAMTYQRVTSVVVPHRVQILCSVRTGKAVVAAIVVVASALNSHFPFTWSYRSQHRQCQYREEFIPFAELFEWLGLVWASIIPFVLLATGNSVLAWQVIRSLRLSRKMRAKAADEKATSGTDRAHSMTVTLMLTSSAFLLLTLPICVMDVCIQVDLTEHPDEEYVALITLGRSVALFMWIASCSTNFYLYLLSGRKFRLEAKRCLRCHDAQHTKRTVSWQ